jgi:hypothetical protein
MRNPDAKHLDFKDLAGLIPEHPKFLPSNLDMVYERHGYFLVCEWKRPNEKFGTGQFILLKTLASTPRFSVLIVTGDTDAGMSVSRIEKLKGNGDLEFRGNCMVHFEGLILTWFYSVEEKHKKTV